MKPKSFEVIVEFTPQSTKTGITYEAHQKCSLIRCRDCKHWKSGFADVGSCDMFKSAGMRCSTISEFFCAMAKPRWTEKLS